jgi:hypothetical protein
MRSIPAVVFNRFAHTFGSNQMKMSANRWTKVLGRAEQVNVTFTHFINNEWIFDTTKTSTLINFLEPADRVTFQLDVTTMNWR